MNNQVAGLFKALGVCLVAGFAGTGLIVAGALDVLPLTVAIGIAVAVFVCGVGLAAWFLIRQVFGPAPECEPAEPGDADVP